MTDRRSLFALLIVLTLAAILGGYYFVHKPVTPAQATALAAPLADALMAVWLTTLAGALGRRILRSWQVLPSPVSIFSTGEPPMSGGGWVGMGVSPGERMTLHAALGWGVMGLAMLALGLAKLYYPALIWLLALTLTLGLWRDLGDWFADWRAALRVFVFPDRLSQLGAVFVAFTLGLGLLTALTPPLKWDAHVYHLTLPQLYAQTHSVKLGGDFFFSGMPQLTEMLYTAAYLLRSGVAAQTLGWAFGAVLALGLAAHASELFGPRLAPLAPALLFASFTIAISLAWAYADLLLMLLALALLIALRQWRLTREHRWLYLAAVFSGLALGCKYTSFILPLATLAVIVFDHLHLVPQSLNHSITQSPNRSITLFILITLALFSPWLLKNFAYTGNPFFPLLFPTATVDRLRLWFYNRPDLTERNPLWAALIFFRAIFLGGQGGNNYDATLTPLLVFLPFTLALGWRKLAAPVRRELAPLALFVSVSYAAWVALTFISYYAIQSRLFFSLFPALALLGVGGLAALAHFDSPTLRLSLIVNALLAFVLGLSALAHFAEFAAHSPLAYLAGAQTAADYRAANLGWYPLAIDKVNALPAGARVLFLWEPRSLDCATPDRCDPDLIIDRWWHLRRTLGSAEAAIAYWKSAGFTHLLIYDLGVDFVKTQAENPFDDSDWMELDRLRSQLHLVENIGGTYSLYVLP